MPSEVKAHRAGKRACAGASSPRAFAAPKAHEDRFCPYSPTRRSKTTVPVGWKVEVTGA